MIDYDGVEDVAVQDGDREDSILAMVVTMATGTLRFDDAYGYERQTLGFQRLEMLTIKRVYNGGDAALLVRWCGGGDRHDGM
ncbi:hypothetical protein L2E82_40992 [Cichorium intybus]|uniref:Uncharacterized protein n=1 Tax=Cichorium intybus TaxID=13427 RepID=A0ACB9ARR3_CICIN|nr:hypothetical protein L2E82_40992 [Cichorium intybus]